jgi:hypothetical protein
MIIPEGPLRVKVNDQVAYSLPEQTDKVFLWSVTGGEIVSGQGTYHVIVKWTNPGEGSVDVTIIPDDHEPEFYGISLDSPASRLLKTR